MRWRVVMVGLMGCGVGAPPRQEPPAATPDSVPPAPASPSATRIAVSEHPAPAPALGNEAEPPLVVIHDHGSGRSAATFPDAVPAPARAGAEPEATSASPPPAASVAEPSSGNPASGHVSNAAQVVGAMRADFRSCYQAALAEDRNMEGRIRVTIRVAASGSVANVTSVPSGLSQNLVDCVVRRAYQAKFDPPEGGSAVIAVPVTFVRDTSKP